MRTPIRAVFSSLMLLGIGCGQSASLPSGVSALAGLDPAIGTDDLAPFAQMVGDASIVGLGESIHTSGGYHEARSRLFRFMVESLGFRVFALETNRLAADATSSYVATCNGDVSGALANISPQYASTTLGELVQWMCQYNQQHRQDPISFYGFDMQDPGADGASLEAFLMKAAGSDAASLIAALNNCNGVGGQQSTGDITAGAYSSCTSAIDMTRTYLSSHRAQLVAASSADEFGLANIALRSIEAWESESYYYDTDRATAADARDLGMADVFLALRALRFPNAKSVIVAHDGHLFMHSQTVTNVLEQGLAVMGTAVAQQVGAKYQAFGFFAYQLDINWPGVAQPGPGGCEALSPPTAPNAIEPMLHAFGRSALLVDLDFPNASTPFLGPTQIYDAGGNDAPSGMGMKPREQFRGLVYLDHSPAMQSLAWGNCP